jgi:hypothetical protein
LCIPEGIHHTQNELKSVKMKWGYELKIVNTKTLKQLNSINAHDLKDYKDVVKH